MVSVEKHQILGEEVMHPPPKHGTFNPQNLPIIPLPTLLSVSPLQDEDSGLRSPGQGPSKDFPLWPNSNLQLKKLHLSHFRKLNNLCTFFESKVLVCFPWLLPLRNSFPLSITPSFSLSLSLSLPPFIPTLFPLPFFLVFPHTSSLPLSFLHSLSLPLPSLSLYMYLLPCHLLSPSPSLLPSSHPPLPGRGRDKRSIYHGMLIHAHYSYTLFLLSAIKPMLLCSHKITSYFFEFLWCAGGAMLHCSRPECLFLFP